MPELLTPIRNGTSAAEAESAVRERALAQLKKKRGFRTHLLAYVLDPVRIAALPRRARVVTPLRTEVSR